MATGPLGHVRAFFYAASDEGTFAGVEQAYGSGPGGGSRNGVMWYYDPANGSLTYWLGPPEAGNGKVVSSSYTCVAESISGDGREVGGVDKSAGSPPGQIYQAVWWDRKGQFVHSVPQLLISGSTYADWMEIHSLNKDGSLMAGIYYTDPPGDSIHEAFVFDGSTVTALADYLAAQSISTTGWTFRDVTAMSDDGNTLVGWGVTNGVDHAWLVQLPAAVIPIHIVITGISLSGPNVVIHFISSNAGDTPSSFTVQSAATLVNAGTAFADVNPAATITGSAGSFQATLAKSGNAQFYQINRP